MEDAISKLGGELQSLRGDIPTFLFVGGTYPPSVVKVRTELSQRPRGNNIQEVDVILHSGGGIAPDAYRIIRSLRNAYETVNIIIPFWAKSAATLMAFGGSRIVFQEFGEMGPIDAQIKTETEDEPGKWESALNVQTSLEQIEQRSQRTMLDLFRKLADNEDVRIGRRQLIELLLDYSAKFYKPLLDKIDTYEIGRRARILAIGRMYAKRILMEFGDLQAGDELENLLDFLVYECPDHGYVIDQPLLREYLPQALKAEDDPFGPSYAKVLERLSILVMMYDTDEHRPLVGFVDNLNKGGKGGQKGDTIPSEQQKPNNNGTAKTQPAEQETSGQTARSRGRPRANPNSSQPRTQTPRRQR